MELFATILDYTIRAICFVYRVLVAALLFAGILACCLLLVVVSIWVYSNVLKPSNGKSALEIASLLDWTMTPLIITSLMIGIHGVLNSLDTFRQEWEKLFPVVQRNSLYYSESGNGGRAEVERQKSLRVRRSCQLVIYAGASLLLWKNLGTAAETSLEFKALNFLLFFVVDDWFVIDGYSSQPNGAALKSHATRIHGINFLIVLATFPLVSTYPDPLKMLSICVMILMALLVAKHWRPSK